MYRLRKRPPSNHQYLNERRRRTNLIIIAVTCIFFVSWLPFNIFSIVTALKPNSFLKFASSADHEGKIIDEDEIENNGTGQLLYGFLHILGAANACTNPILYGLLNENFLVQYKRLYRWLPGYYGERARRRSIPGFQQFALNNAPGLARQNAFRVPRLSIYPSSNNAGQDMDTSDEQLQDSKSKTSMNLSCCEKNGEEVESRSIERKCHNKGADTVYLSTKLEPTIPMHLKTIAIINQGELSRVSTFNYEQDIPKSCKTIDCKMLSTPTHLKELLHNYSEINKAEKSMDNDESEEVENNRNRCFGRLSRLRNKNVLLQESSFSLDDVTSENRFDGATEKLMQLKEPEKPKGNMFENEADYLCSNCSQNEPITCLSHGLFSSNQSPKSPGYSIIVGKNKLKLLDNIIRKLEDVDSAYEDDYYSPCPTTTETLASKVFDFDNIEVLNECCNIPNPSKATPCNLQTEKEKSLTNTQKDLIKPDKELAKDKQYIELGLAKSLYDGDLPSRSMNKTNGLKPNSSTSLSSEKQRTINKGCEKKNSLFLDILKSPSKTHIKRTNFMLNEKHNETYV